MPRTFAQLRLSAEFYGCVLKAATYLPPDHRAQYFAEAAETLEALRLELAPSVPTPPRKPAAERP